MNEDSATLIKASFKLSAMAIGLPEVDDHPNRKPFKGVLTRVDEPSDAPPSGSNAKRVIIPSLVAEYALPSLLGMAVDTDPYGAFDGHDATFKIGLITEANVVGDAVEIGGFFYASDFPEIWAKIQEKKDALGFSYECRARIHDITADVWVVSDCIFTGAALLYKDLAAYTTTSLSAKATNFKKELSEMELKDLMDAITNLSASVGEIKSEVATLKAGASLSSDVVDKVKPHVEACNKLAAELEADGIGCHPDKGHAVYLRNIGAHLAAEAVSGRIPTIYRDHDYLPDARIEALTAASDEKTNKLEATVADLTTKLKDLDAKAFNHAAAPERKTAPAGITAILAKAGLTDSDAGKQMSVEQVDAILDAQKITGTQALEFKIKLNAAGLLKTAN